MATARTPHWSPPAVAGGNLHPILAQRWSPRAYSGEHRCTDAELTNLLEAARWSPSHNNSQPWRFIVGRRDDEVFALLLDCLVPGNRRWAASASVLVCGLAVLHDDTGAELRWSRYDLGQAMAYMTVQAYADGLHGRQMAGFDPDALRRLFRVGADYDPCIIAAFGVMGDGRNLPEVVRVRDARVRERTAADQLVYVAGSPGFVWCRPDRPTAPTAAAATTPTPR
jgi:hypothetical protein